MPRSIVSSNAVLLLCLSILAGLGLPVLRGSGHPLGADPGTVWVLAGIALVTGFVLLGTELFSGHRVIALIAFVGVVVGAVSTYRTGIDSVVAEWAWLLGLVAMVLWFTVLASVARTNR